MALTAFSCMSGSTWEQMSIVMEMFACPSISCTILGCVPLVPIIHERLRKLPEERAI